MFQDDEILRRRRNEGTPGHRRSPTGGDHHVETIYSTAVTSTGDGREGHVRSDDGLLDLDVHRPGSMGGDEGATNPEQLFAAGYAACFHSALKAVARNTGVDAAGTEITANVGLQKGDGRFALTVALHLRADDLDDDTAWTLLQQAHQLCPYSEATRNNIDVQLHLDRP
jgi:lipoyl-dependent peroxiredoxin